MTSGYYLSGARAIFLGVVLQTSMGANCCDKSDTTPDAGTSLVCHRDGAGPCADHCTACCLCEIGGKPGETDGKSGPCSVCEQPAPKGCVCDYALEPSDSAPAP